MDVLAIFGLGVPELLIILAVVLLLFGGSRLAGLGKSTGRALKEFKEETKGLKPGDAEGTEPTTPTTTSTTTTAPPPQVTQDPNPQASRPTEWQEPPPSNTAPGNVSDAPSSDARKDV